MILFWQLCNISWKWNWPILNGTFWQHWLKMKWADTKWYLFWHLRNIGCRWNGPILNGTFWHPRNNGWKWNGPILIGIFWHLSNIGFKLNGLIPNGTYLAALQNWPEMKWADTIWYLFSLCNSCFIIHLCMGRFYFHFHNKIFTTIEFWKVTLLSKKIPFSRVILLFSMFYSTEPRGRIFSHVWPFYECAVSDQDSSMHRSLWV
jgi:hypothetical protein